MLQGYPKAVESECLSDTELAVYIDGTLEASRARHEAHLSQCNLCSELLALCALTLEQRAEPEQERYRIESLVGRGASGAVYRVFDNALDRHIALKFLRQDTGADEVEDSETLTLEARLLAKLAHPNIVAIHDIGSLDGRAYVAMELVDGTTLLRWLHGETRSTEQIVDVLVQAGQGLGAAHKAGVVHRDVKPSNILVGDDGRVRLVDFGLASDESAATLDAFAGTQRYRAPELSPSVAATPLSDQYSYAVTAYQALVGELPEVGAQFDVALLPKPLAGAIAKALATDPADRFLNLGEFVAALEASQRSPGRRAAGFAALALGLLGLALALVLVSKASPATTAADSPERPHSAEARAELDRLGEILTSLKNIAREGKYADALHKSTAVLASAITLDHPPFTTGLLLFRGQLQTLLGELDAAETTYREAASSAARAKDDGQVAEVWIKVVDLLVLQNRFEEALTLEAVAVTSAERVPEDTIMQARLQRSLGAIYFGLERHEEAQEYFSRALTTFRTAGPEAPLWLPAILGNLSLTKMALGDTSGALVDMKEARDLALEGKGPDHPEVGYLQLNIASLQSDLNQLEAARQSVAEAIRIFTAAFDAGHPNLASAHEVLSNIAMKAKQYSTAQDHIETALQMRSTSLGEDNVAVLTTLHAAATVHMTVGTSASLQRAMNALSRARGIHENLGKAVRHLRPETQRLEDELAGKRVAR